MKKKDPALWAALRLQRILSGGRPHPHGDPIARVSELLREERRVQRNWRMYKKAQALGWNRAADVLFGRLNSSIAAVNAASQPIPRPQLPDIPRARDILAEIDSLGDEFDEVEILHKERRIDVTTDEITLAGVALGPFTIKLNFAALAQRRDVLAFAIHAQQANPAASKNGCTHPHVMDKHLCAGDATVPIACALSEGRIGDAFQLVNRVLHTYNPGSAYVSLDDWDGQTCSDCGTTTSSLYHCGHCESDFCDDCIRVCDRCRDSICIGCSVVNDDGNRLCPHCEEEQAKEREKAHEEENQAAVSDNSVHHPAEEQPQPQTETSHEQSPDAPDAQPVGLSGGPSDGEAAAVTADILETLAARAAIGGDLLPAGLAQVPAVPARRRHRSRRVRHQRREAAAVH
jgi:uncharacterized Zn finger protein (UPF0148 family)